MTPVANRKWQRASIFALGSLIVVALIVVLYIQIPWWLDGSRLRHLAPGEQQELIAANRDNLLKLIAGVGGLVLVIYTMRRHTVDRDTLRVTQETLGATLDRDTRSTELAIEAQVTDRYTKAVGHLASENRTERLGGIYALERIMRDSPKDHETIVELIAAFVRERAVAPGPGAPHRTSGRTIELEPEGLEGFSQPTAPDADVQAALTVLGRRPERPEAYSLDLHHTWLSGVDLSGARLARANLFRTNLVNANLIEADLRNSYLSEACVDNARLYDAQFDGANLAKASLIATNCTGARMERAILLGADMQDAILAGANMTRANLYRAKLDGADLFGTHLDEANLRAASLVGARLRGTHFGGAMLAEADLRDVRQLIPQRLTGAWVEESTLLPEGVQLGDNNTIKAAKGPAGDNDTQGQTRRRDPRPNEPTPSA